MKAKGYDLDEVERVRAVVEQDLTSLLQKLADDKPADTSEKGNEPEITIMKRTKVGSGEDKSSEDRDPEGKEVVGTKVESIPEEVLMETKLRRKKM